MMASEEHLPCSSPPLPPRKRRLSPIPSPSRSPSSDGRRSPSPKKRRTGLTVDVCKDFRRRICRRSEVDCKFAHPHSTVVIENDRVTACGDALRNKCIRGQTCRYYHPPPHIQGLLLKAIGVQEPKVERVCRDFLRGRCVRGVKECRFVHHSSIGDRAVVCQDFLRGRCDRNSCRYLHGQVRVPPQVPLVQYGSLITMPSPPPRAGNGKEVLQVCKDFLKNKCYRDECRYAHPIPKTEVTDNSVEVCKDFLKNKCHRDECKYAHPIPKTEVTDNSVEVCRDFRLGACHRSVCRFYHPLKQT